MKITVKNGEEILISREDAVSVVDKGGAYEVFYADETGQLVYKDESVEITLELSGGNSWEKLNMKPTVNIHFLLAVKQKLWGLSHAKSDLKTAGF